MEKQEEWFLLNGNKCHTFFFSFFFFLQGIKPGLFLGPCQTSLWNRRIVLFCEIFFCRDDGSWGKISLLTVLAWRRWRFKKKKKKYSCFGQHYGVTSAHPCNFLFLSSPGLVYFCSFFAPSTSLSLVVLYFHLRHVFHIPPVSSLSHYLCCTPNAVWCLFLAQNL